MAKATYPLASFASAISLRAPSRTGSIAFRMTAISDFAVGLLLAEGVWKRVWKTRLSYVVAMSTVLAVVPVQRVG